MKRPLLYSGLLVALALSIAGVRGVVKAAPFAPPPPAPSIKAIHVLKVTNLAPFRYRLIVRLKYSKDMSDAPGMTEIKSWRGDDTTGTRLTYVSHKVHTNPRIVTAIFEFPVLLASGKHPELLVIASNYTFTINTTPTSPIDVSGAVVTDEPIQPVELNPCP
jgi:hypothetical protein